MWTALRLRWLMFWGAVANLAGYPCLLREGRYRSDAHDVEIRVRSSNLYTVISVNGVDVYFYRLTGGFEGVGINPTFGYIAADGLGSTRSA